MSRLQNVEIKSQDSPSIDPFARWRVSNPTTIFDSKQIFDNQPLFWDERLFPGAGITSAHSTATASTVITSTVNTAGTFTRQTFMRHNYQPGKGQLIYMTGVLQRSGGGAGVQRRLGLFDDDNGLFFADIAGVMNVVRRTSVTGAPVDNPIPRAQWSLDRLDGSGGEFNPSGLNVDFSLSQIFCIDFEWLGTGRVRIGVIIDGMVIIAHEFLNANVLAVVFMSTPNLPLRYQMITTNVSPASTLEAMCGTVISEGGLSDTGVLRYASTEGTHISADVANTIYAIMGIRLKAANLGARIVIENISMVNAQNDDFEWMLIINPTVAVAITFGNQANSSVQTGPGNAGADSDSKLTNGTFIGGGLVKGGNNAGDIQVDVSSALLLGAQIDGTPDEIYLACRPLTNMADIDAGFTWRESP